MNNEMNNSQIERIAAMEAALNEATAVLDAMEAAITRWEQQKPQLEALKAYYQSPQWLADLDDDRAGRLPKTLRRGVLSEDAVYDLLCDVGQMRQRLQRVAESMKDAAAE